MPIELEDTALPTSTPTASAPSASATATAIPRETPGSDAPAAQLPPGKRLAHFKIDRLLGEGGMGQVYLATDLALDRPVALKVLPPAVAQDPGRRQRLIREARAQARINHPNVCHIYFIGEEDGHLFFAMEYVDGESVADLVANGPLPVDRALSIVKMAAEGLREADRRGFTHRDVKPSNLMIDRDGRVKVVDFGLVTDAPRAGDDPENVAQTGVAGTPLYMAPEQARGEPVDRRADVYALGATLYHLVAGAPPFAATSAGELLAMHSTALRPALPKRGRGREMRRLPVLYELYSRMMAADPDERFASYDDLINELDRVTPAVTRPAGIVARGAAALLDLLILVPFAILAEMLPYQLVIRDEIVWLPALWLYGTLATWRYGRTLGKALLDLEVVSIRSRRPKVTLGAAALRTALYTAPLWIGVLLRQLGDALANRLPGAAPIIATVGKALIPLAVAWAIAALAWTSWRRPDKRTPWDRVTGTMVRYLRPAS
jgi:predicted Ser/Thr protein kinase